MGRILRRSLPHRPTPPALRWAGCALLCAVSLVACGDKDDDDDEDDDDGSFPFASGTWLMDFTSFDSDCDDIGTDIDDIDDDPLALIEGDYPAFIMHRDGLDYDCTVSDLTFDCATMDHDGWTEDLDGAFANDSFGDGATYWFDPDLDCGVALNFELLLITPDGDDGDDSDSSSNGNVGR
jgi:hypothetical protein